MSQQLIGIYTGYEGQTMACFHVSKKPFPDTIHFATKTQWGDKSTRQYFRQPKPGMPYKASSRSSSEFTKAILDIEPIVKVDFSVIDEGNYEIVIYMAPGTNWLDVYQPMVDLILGSLKWQRKGTAIGRYDEFIRLNSSMQRFTSGGTAPHRSRNVNDRES